MANPIIVEGYSDRAIIRGPAEAIQLCRRKFIYPDPANPLGFSFTVHGSGVMLPGLVAKTVDFLRRRNMEVEARDCTGEPFIELPDHGLPLYSYQYEPVEIMSRVKRGILFAPPGAGKTVMAAALIKRLEHARPALFLVERKELARQAQAELSDWLGTKVGFIGDGVEEYFDDDIWVGMIPTLKGKLHRRFARVAAARYVIYDEVHHSAAKANRKVIFGMRRSWRVHGLSGTPWRNDGLDLLLEGVVGPIRATVPEEKLTAVNRLTRVLCLFAKVPRGTAYDDTPNTYGEQYNKLIVNHDERNECAASLLRWGLKQGLSGIILVDRIPHGELLAKLTGLKFVHGTSPSEERKQVLADLREGRINGVITTLYREAVDIPRLDIVVDAGAGKSSIKVIQSMRNRRAYPGKNIAIYLNFWDEGVWVAEHSSERHSVCERMGWECQDTDPWRSANLTDHWNFLIERVKNG